MAKRHWKPSDFVVTSTSPAYDGKGGQNRAGYCRQCKGDMQSFTHSGRPGPILHYKSHGAARKAGLGSQRTGSSKEDTVINFADLHKRYPLIVYGTLVQGHKALGHSVHDTFWATKCLTCPWTAYVQAVGGNPFDPADTSATFIVQASYKQV